jgi:TFIIF-interacting CTD phosphatase-like protein
LIRPYAREFLRNMAQYYEVHIFTASVKSYADPIIDLLDINKVVRKRYYRDHCIRIKDQFYKVNIYIHTHTYIYIYLYDRIFVVSIRT